MRLQQAGQEGSTPEELEYQNILQTEKSQKVLGYIGKPPRGPEKQPLYNFQKQHQPIRNRVKV